MPSCTLRIELDEPDRTFRPGDDLRGVVHVDVDDDCDCRSLRVILEWYTHDHDLPENSGSQQTQVLCTGLWQRGQRHNYRFDIGLPNGPCSYEGHEFNVSWRLVATADIPWTIDPRDEILIDVDPGSEPVETPFFVGDFRNAQRPPTDHRSAPNSPAVVGCIFAFCMAFIGFCCYFLGGAIGIIQPDLDGDAGSVLPYMVVPALVTAVAIAVVWKFFLKNRLAEMRLGHIDVSLDRSEIHAGQSLEVTVDIPPPSHAHINEISTELIAFEEVALDETTRRRTRSHILHRHRDTIADSVDRTVPKGESARFQHTVAVPADGPPSFRSEHTKVDWKVVVHIDIADWPDWEETLYFDVYPPGTSGD